MQTPWSNGSAQNRFGDTNAGILARPSGVTILCACAEAERIKKFLAFLFK
jgi:hypothetical protein